MFFLFTRILYILVIIEVTEIFVQFQCLISYQNDRFPQRVLAFSRLSWKFQPLQKGSDICIQLTKNQRNSKCSKLWGCCGTGTSLLREQFQQIFLLQTEMDPLVHRSWLLIVLWGYALHLSIYSHQIVVLFQLILTRSVVLSLRKYPCSFKEAMRGFVFSFTLDMSVIFSLAWNFVFKSPSHL